MANNNGAPKRVRSIYVTDVEYEYVQRQLNILRTSANLAYDNKIRESVKDWRRPDFTEERAGDNHE